MQLFVQTMSLTMPNPFADSAEYRGSSYPAHQMFVPASRQVHHILLLNQYKIRAAFWQPQLAATVIVCEALLVNLHIMDIVKALLSYFTFSDDCSPETHAFRHLDLRFPHDNGLMRASIFAQGDVFLMTLHLCLPQPASGR